MGGSLEAAVDDLCGRVVAILVGAAAEVGGRELRREEHNHVAFSRDTHMEHRLLAGPWQ
jgi:hypothetical protein